ncbi:MAG: VOC family protein [Candidatus Zixiibacteriota bacterium]
MSTCRLDHLVITAPTLEVGEDYVEQLLGDRPTRGGVHERMATHNSLLSLGDSIYLEVIAVIPGEAPPPHPRWFALDALPADAPPRLATWVVRCDDIRAAVAASPVPLGEIVPMRRGGLEWLITIPSDGQLPMDGTLPAVIQWTRGQHPAARLGRSGCSLTSLEVRHPEAGRIRSILSAIGFHETRLDIRVGVGEAACCLAAIQTPAGVRWIGTGQ